MNLNCPICGLLYGCPHTWAEMKEARQKQREAREKREREERQRKGRGDE